jgi:hypothetical protein
MQLREKNNKGKAFLLTAVFFKGDFMRWKISCELPMNNIIYSEMTLDGWTYDYN